MVWNSRLTNIRDVMVSLFTSLDAPIELADEAGINTNHVNLPSNKLSRWHNIIKEAEKTLKVMNLIDVALIRYPKNPNLLQFKNSDYNSIRGPDIKTETTWQASTDEETLEKIIGGSSQLLPISFLEKGVSVSSSIGRIINPIDEVGTGFIIGNNFVVTNHHVLPNEDVASESIIEFNFQQSVSGADVLSETFHFFPEDGFQTSVKNDLTIVKLSADVSKKYGEINLDKTTDVSTGERVSIIQHPGGLHKQVALHDNHIVYSDENIIQYLTDTMPGSSGSPVFNQNWELVAIHHSGGWLREANSKKKYFRNEGIKVKHLLELL